MKLPSDIDGEQLVGALSVHGYTATRQTGFHICVTTQLDGENHEVIPHHSPLKTGTLASILKNIAAHHKLTVESLLLKLHL
jgi:predicted RNA binding protein YcfA (HicA-like mRNA interferase family)